MIEIDKTDKHILWINTTPAAVINRNGTVWDLMIHGVKFGVFKTPALASQRFGEMLADANEKLNAALEEHHGKQNLPQ